MFTLILIGFLTFLLFCYYKNKYSYWSKRGVKGPPAYPILGTFLAEHELPADEMEKKFYKEFGPVFGGYYNVTPVFNTADPDHIKTVLNDLRTFPNLSTVRGNDEYFDNSIFFRSDNRWKTGRAAQTHYYTSKNLRNLMIHLEKTTANFIENIEAVRRQTGTDDVDAKKMAKFYSIDGISKVLFAIDVDSYKERDTLFVKSVSTLGDLNPFNLALCTILPDSFVKYFQIQPFKIKPINNLATYFKKMINERKKSGIKYNDLSEVLQDAVDENRVKMTENEVIGNCLLSFFAGVEAVSTSLSRMLHYLCLHPDVQQKLYDEVKNKFSGETMAYEDLMQNEYLDAVTKEVLRLGATFLLITRTAAVDTKLGDYEIERGTEIRLMTYARHTASDAWSDALTFNPDRFLKGSQDNQDNFFIPFGFAHKQCLGMRLALLEIKFAVVNILKKYELRKPAQPKNTFASFRGVMNLQSLNVTFKNRTD